MALDDDLYLDNQESEVDEDDDLLGSAGDDADDGEPERGRGDIRVALRKEREQSRLLKEQLAQRDKDLERHQTLLQQLGQRRDEPKVDPAALRETLSNSLLERPDEVFQLRDNQLLSQVQRMQAPLYARMARSDVMDDPQYGELYRSRPAFKKTVDAWIQNSVSTYGAVDPQALQETLAYLGEIAKEAGGPATSNDAAKRKLSSVADKSGGTGNRKTAEQILEEKSKLAKTNRREYLKWADSPEGKRILDEALKSSG